MILLNIYLISSYNTSNYYCTVAKEVADKGRIKVNGILAKSSTDLKINDQVEIRFGNKMLLVKVLEMKDSTKKEDAAGMYEIISETRVEEDV